MYRTFTSFAFPVAVTIAFVFSPSASASAQTPRFDTHADYSSGYGPASLVVADFNGDHVDDIASANHLDNTIGLLLGNGDGTFQPLRSVYLDPNTSPRSIAAADFNRDGKVDVAGVAPDSNGVFILAGNGDGTFQPIVTLAAGLAPRSVVAADFNGDGNFDLAIANTTTNDVSVLLGNGDGTFQTARAFLADSGPTFVTASDLDRDGRPDLIVANSGSGRIAVLIGNGDGTFQAPRTFAPGNMLSVWSVAVGDFNKDGAPDLVATNYESTTVSVLIGNGDGTFQVWRGYQDSGGPTSVAVADLNGDGNADLAVAHENDGTIEGSAMVSVLLGNGDGTFGAPRSFAIGGVSWAVAVGNFNGDGVADVVAANTYSTTVSVLLGQGDGTFPAPLTLRVGHNPEGLAAGDLNSDGKSDLVVTNAGSNTLSVLLGNGDGTFQPELTFPAGPVPVFVAVGDFNRDNRQDLVVANYGSNNYYSATVASTVSVLLGNGDGTFQPAQTFEAGSGPHGIAIGDFDRDGIQDLAVANLGPYPDRATTVAVLIGVGDGTFRAPQTFIAGHALTGVAIGDFNRDGVQDLALSSGDDATVAVLLGNGNGTFQSATSMAVGNSPKSVSGGDVNGDQIADLVVTDHFSDTVSVLLGNGDGTFSMQRVFGTGRNPAWVVIADLNGDGFADLAVADWFATTVSVLRGKGDGTFEAAQPLGAQSSPEKVVLADFDGDGRPDLAVANYFSASVSVLLNRVALPRVATPSFDPPAGTYVGTQTVTISVATPGATIHVTTNGTAPTTASPVYSGPIVVTKTTTIRAMAAMSGMLDSAGATAAYTIKAVPPAFSPAAGTYDRPQSVTLSTPTAGAVVHYTTDGSVPTETSATYSGPIAVSRTTTIRAIAVASGMTNSDAAVATYTLQAATPSFNPPDGAYLLPQFVEISSASPGVTIYYTTDGSAPTSSSTQYTEPILVLTTTTIRAIAIAPGWSQSTIATATYRIPF